MSGVKSRGLSPVGVSSPEGTGWIKWLDNVAPSAIADITVISIAIAIAIAIAIVMVILIKHFTITPEIKCYKKSESRRE